MAADRMAENRAETRPPLAVHAASMLAGTQNRVILGAKRGFLKSAREGDIRRVPLDIRQLSEATAAKSRGCLASEREDLGEQANVMPEILENASFPRKRRNSIPINSQQAHH
jgi:hypothetical protein